MYIIAWSRWVGVNLCMHATNFLWYAGASLRIDLNFMPLCLPNDSTPRPIAARPLLEARLTGGGGGGGGEGCWLTLALIAPLPMLISTSTTNLKVADMTYGTVLKMHWFETSTATIHKHCSQQYFNWIINLILMCCVRVRANLSKWWTSAC
jgi:hypothetical protein